MSITQTNHQNTMSNAKYKKPIYRIFLNMQNYFMHNRNKISSSFIWDGKTENENSKTVQFTVQKLYLNIYY